MYRVARSVVLLTAALLVAACSASDYTAPVTELSKATKTAATSFKTNKESLEALAKAQRLKLASDGGNIVAKKGDCTVRSEHCRLMVVDKNGNQKPLNAAFDQLQDLMNGLVDYTDNLVAIVNADTAGEVTKGTDAVKTSLTSLAQTATSLAQARGLSAAASFASAEPFIAPVSDAANFALTKALEAEKVAALRRATAQMETIFPTLTIVFDAVNADAQRIQSNQINAAYRKADSDFRHKPSPATRDAYEQAANAYDLALSGKNNPKSVFDDLKEAHGALAQALTSPNPSFSELFALLQKATDDANKLAEINKAFQKARAASSKPS